MAKREYLNFILLLLFATFFMGSSFPTGKFLISIEVVPPFFLGGIRFMIAGLIVLVVCIFLYGVYAVCPRSKNSVLRGCLYVFVIGLLQTASAMGFLNLSLMRIDSALAAVLFFTNPLWVLVFGHYARLERLTLQKIIGLVLGLFGVFLCLKVKASGDYLGWIFALLGAMSWALCTVLTRSVCKVDNSAITLAGWQMLLGGLVLLMISLVTNESYSWLSLTGWGWFNFIWLVIPASIGSFCLWFLALQKGGVAEASSFLFLTPMFATLFAIIFLHEALTVRLIGGCLLIFCSIYVVNKRQTQPKSREHLS